MTIARKSTILGAALSGLLLSLGAPPAAADGFEKPILTAAYANAPGAITLAWTHPGGVWDFAVEEASGAYRFVGAEKRAWTVPNLRPSTTYRFHVCAFYSYYDYVCSDYASVTTMPPEAPRPSPPPPPPLPPKPVAKQLPAPKITASIIPRVPAVPYPYVVQLSWANPVDAAQLSVLKRMDWYRDGKLAFTTISEQHSHQTMWSDNRDPYAMRRYKLCIENDVNRVCSNEVTVRPVQGKPIPPATPQPVTPAPLPSKNALPASAFTCAAGYVWRVARPSDLVCVTPDARDRVAEENHAATTRVQPGGGAYGPNTCRSGYVWRGAFSGDLVCVTPQSRALAAQENQLGASRLSSAIVASSPPVLKSGPLPSKGALPRP